MPFHGGGVEPFALGIKTCLALGENVGSGFGNGGIIGKGGAETFLINDDEFGVLFHVDAGSPHRAGQEAHFSEEIPGAERGHDRCSPADFSTTTSTVPLLII